MIKVEVFISTNLTVGLPYEHKGVYEKVISLSAEFSQYQLWCDVKEDVQSTHLGSCGHEF